MGNFGQIVSGPYRNPRRYANSDAATVSAIIENPLLHVFSTFLQRTQKIGAILDKSCRDPTVTRDNM